MNIASSKAKLEQELTTLAGDYEEVTKELRVSDERYQRVQNELKHTVEILHEEQERIVKIEAIKKSLEIEVKNLSVRLEEVEANAIVGGKRIISKLEARVKKKKKKTNDLTFSRLIKTIMIDIRYRNQKFIDSRPGTRIGRGETQTLGDREDFAQEGTKHQGGNDPSGGRLEEHRFATRIVGQGESKSQHL